jgi:hypothetical protein
MVRTPALAEGRAMAVPQPKLAAKPVEKPAERPAAGVPMQRSAAAAAPRPVWLSELDDQPPEKWLARLAEFKRDGRMADADVLMAEFRRRFPDHPASAR